MTLWREFQQEEYDLGGDIIPNDYNALQAHALFHYYVTGDLRGGVFLHEDKAVVMAGETPPQQFGFQTRYPHYATVWGLYVRPEYRRQGLSHRLLDFGRQELSAEFDGYFSSINPSEAAKMNALNYKQTQRHTLVINSPFPKEGQS
jgi:GNAT superfamily N-acetyltransferase